jgi:hypothetical protein
VTCGGCHTCYDYPYDYPYGCPCDCTYDYPYDYPYGCPYDCPYDYPYDYSSDYPYDYSSDYPYDYPYGCPYDYPYDCPYDCTYDYSSDYPYDYPYDYSSDYPYDYPYGCPSDCPYDYSSDYPYDYPYDYSSDYPYDYSSDYPYDYPWHVTNVKQLNVSLCNFLPCFDMLCRNVAFSNTQRFWFRPKATNLLIIQIRSVVPWLRRSVIRPCRVSSGHLAGRAMAQAVSYRPLTTKTQLQSQASVCEICGGQSVNWTGFLPALRSPSVSIILPTLQPHSSPTLR